MIINEIVVHILKEFQLVCLTTGQDRYNFIETKRFKKFSIMDRANVFCSPQKRTITNNFLTQHPSFFQASWVCRCDTSFVLNLENEFKSILGAPADLETWAEWLQSVVNIALASVSGTTTFTKAARQFLLKWSFYRLVPLQSFLLQGNTSLKP